MSSRKPIITFGGSGQNSPRLGTSLSLIGLGYGRVLVERVEGFCTKGDWRRAFREINEMEENFHHFGAIILKFWIQISKKEQLTDFALVRMTHVKAGSLMRKIGVTEKNGLITRKPSRKCSLAPTRPTPRGRSSKAIVSGMHAYRHLTLSSPPSPHDCRKLLVRSYVIVCSVPPQQTAETFILNQSDTNKS